MPPRAPEKSLATPGDAAPDQPVAPSTPTDHPKQSLIGDRQAVSFPTGNASLRRDAATRETGARWKVGATPAVEGSGSPPEEFPRDRRAKY